MSSSGKAEVGSIVSLWRYPVKSMMGEEVNASRMTDRGLSGDRAYALVDPSSGKVVSAKNPRKWPGLFAFRASFVGSPGEGKVLPPVRITLPDGSVVTNDQSDLDDVLSQALGREVRFVWAPPAEAKLEEYWPDMEGLSHREVVTEEPMPVGFFDLAVVHLLTTATIDRLRELYPAGRFEVRRFRPNIVVEPGPGAMGFVEGDWIGHTLALGDRVRLKITGPCPRCVMTTLAQGDLPKDPGILRTAAHHNQTHVGVYAAVERGGTVRREDPVRLE